MKKIFTVIFIMLIALVVVGCGTDSNKGNSGKEQADLKQTSAAKPQINFTEVAIATLSNDLRENALLASDKYKGKNLKIVGGNLNTIDSDGRYIGIAGPKGFLSKIHASIMNNEQRNQIKLMKRNQPLVLYGHVTDVGEIAGYYIDIIKIIPEEENNNIQSGGTVTNNVIPNNNLQNSTNMNPQSAMPAITSGAISTATHSSADKEGDYIHSALLTVDGDIKTCWSEGVPGIGVGEFIQIYFNGNYKVNGLNIWIGHQKSEDLFYKNARPVAIRVIGSDGSNQVYLLADRMGGQRVNFVKPINVGNVKIVVEKVARGNQYEDTCIAEVSFF